MTRARCLAVCSCLSATALLLACANEGGDKGEGDMIVDTGDDDPDTCAPGRFGCTCMNGNSCVTGLEACELLSPTGELS